LFGTVNISDVQDGDYNYDSTSIRLAFDAIRLLFDWDSTTVES